MVQEEAIASWIEAMDEKKNIIKQHQAKCEKIMKENDEISSKMAKVKEDYDNVVQENIRLSDLNQ
jgi:ribulose 1,5-bisphosphate carboxylase large subunit-like protein